MSIKICFNNTLKQTTRRLTMISLLVFLYTLRITNITTPEVLALCFEGIFL